MRQLERFQQRAQAIVPIGNHRKANALLPQRRQRGNDVLVHMPTFRLGEVTVEFPEKCLAGQLRNQAFESGIHHRRPIGPSVLKGILCLPRLDKASG